MTEHLRFSPEILRRLGEELVTHIEQGVIELVRNAYDADAYSCSVEIPDGELGGTIIVRDDGVGMDSSTIRDGWLLLGRSRKALSRRTSSGRLTVGDKGLGRLSALRLGSRATLATRPASRPGVELRLRIDWADFDRATAVEDVAVEITEHPTSDKPGTDIRIDGLRRRIGRRETQRIARSLILLADPFATERGFRPRLVSPAFADLEERVQKAYFDQAELTLVATLSEEGEASAQVLDSSGRVRFRTAPGQMQAPYRAPAATFELWAFLLDSRAFSHRAASLAEVKDWLDVAGGVHIYHRGLRAYPYGDPGFDWLDMNLARVRNPELRPSTNTSVGRLLVDDPEEQLSQKTDRTAFVENEAFLELRRFARDALEWMARERVREREHRRTTERKKSTDRVERAEATVARVVEAVPEKQREPIKKALDSLDRAREREARTLRAEVQLYRTLATVGTSAALFAHDAGKPLTQIVNMTKSVEARGRARLGEDYDSILGGPVELIAKSAKALQTYAGLPIHLLRREKRRTDSVNLNAAVLDVVGLFEPFLTDSKIQADVRLAEQLPLDVWGSVAAVEALLANLITNAIGAFGAVGARLDDREIRITTERGSEQAELRVSDNGPGIRGIPLDDVWLPGRSTTPEGTGLGLTIVRDVISDMGGTVAARNGGDLGGAEFVVMIPLHDT